jgi:hypothetical protein
MRTSRWSTAVLGFCLILAVPARADVISDWVEAARTIGEETRATAEGRSAGRFVHAQVALAMFEAVNAIDRRYESYLGFPKATTPASQEAAAAVAAHDVLKASYPARGASFAQSLAFALGAISDGPPKTAGVQVGRDAAAAVLKRTVLDGTVKVPEYRPRGIPGVYILTDLPVLPLSAYATIPWILKTRDEVAPAPPPALNSERYAKDFEEVRRLGAKDSIERTPAQTAAANFWAGNRTDLAMRLLTSSAGRRLVTNARAYALREMAYDDAATSVTIAKYDAALWRPITAIRNADQDENPLTNLDAAWLPLLQTPPFAEYPCGHCIGAAVAAGLIEAEFGPDARLTFPDPTMPGAGRTVTPGEYVREVSMSRIYAGVHYRFSNEAAEEMGRRIATLAVQRYMRPLTPGSTR